MEQLWKAVGTDNRLTTTMKTPNTPRTQTHSGMLASRLRALPARSDLGLAERYDEAAPTWDTTLRKLRMPQVYANLIADLSRDGLLPARLQHVLDIGIGTGALAHALLNQASGIQVLDGFDISAAMLASARANLKQSGIQLNLCQQDITDWRVQPNRYDIVISAHTLEHVSDPTAVVEKVYGSLRDGGSFLLMVTRQSLWGRYIQARWHTVQPTTVRELQLWLAQAGFEAIHHIPTRGNLISRGGSLAVIAKKPDSLHAQRSWTRRWRPS